MVTSIHTMIYSDDPPVTRAFLRDVIGWSFVEFQGAGPGWLIFNSGPSEMGVHPTTGEWDGHTFSYPLQHSITLMCDDLPATIAEMKSKGAEFSGDIVDHGYGPFINLILPAAGEIMLLQPSYPTAFS